MSYSYPTPKTDSFTKFIKGDENPDFADRLAKLKKGVDILISQHKAKWSHLKDRKVDVTFNTGKRYIKMIYAEEGHRRVHGFVDRTNGDILGSASWNAPAKSGARGSIWNEDYGLNSVGEYGVHYKGQFSDNSKIVEQVNKELK